MSIYYRPVLGFGLVCLDLHPFFPEVIRIPISSMRFSQYLELFKKPKTKKVKFNVLAFIEDIEQISLGEHIKRP